MNKKRKNLIAKAEELDSEEFVNVQFNATYPACKL